MCGKFKQDFSLAHLAALLKLPPVPALPAAQATPGKAALAIVREATHLTAQTMRWGFASAPGLGVRPVINARAETLAHKPMFATAFRHARCALPVSLYLEGLTAVRLPDLPLFYLGGLYQRGADGMAEFTVITRAPTDDLKTVHDRMPLVLADRVALDGWLNHADQPGDYPPFAHEETSARPTDNRQISLF